MRVPFGRAARFDYNIYLIGNIRLEQLVDVLARQSAFAFQILAAHINENRTGRVGIVHGLLTFFVLMLLEHDRLGGLCFGLRDCAVLLRGAVA